MSAGFIFSFKPRFVNQIRAGFGLPDLADVERFPPSAGQKKLQTIRAERKDGKRPEVGQEVHLFTGMRQPDCMRIVPRQTAFVTRICDITIVFDEWSGIATPQNDSLKITPGVGLRSPVQLYSFARDDGFADWSDFRTFWDTTHPRVTEFEGFITFFGRHP